MEQTEAMIGLLSDVQSKNGLLSDGMGEQILSYKSELESWISKLQDELSISKNQTLPKVFLEPLFDKLEEIYKDLSKKGLLKIPPESEWQGVVPDFYSLTGLHNSIRCGSGGWNPCPTKFKVRGINYLRDSVKIQSQSALFHLKAVQLLSTETLLTHVAQCSNFCSLPTNRDNEEYLILNYMVPGTPPVNVVFLFVASSDAYKVLSSPDTSSPSSSPLSSPCPSPHISNSNSSFFNSNAAHETSSTEKDDIDKKLSSTSMPNIQSITNDLKFSSTTQSAKEKEKDRNKCVTSFDPLLECGWAKSLKEFWRADQTYCDQRFKLIPSVEDGPWAIKLAVGTKPALTGTKLRQLYFRGKGYFEVDVDLGSSPIAAKILVMVRPVSKMLTVDIGITIQGNSREELPERILCQTRCKSMDFTKAEPLAEGEIL
mmetsp:Transcript_9029/g.9078  ORF Transcript_9029/g.9078 Transcript_9029/m.9078 type:complete len:428 (-) Transcript_9029:325-1608(-)|eukprot:CAMPEP_0182430992 /NCGR_PEP_ID=MMETSP1167-20130531/45473_1 /TAXON_ID=2988 /ORGANISM="Mallomonas Sp, Strain CCMP3275" /LENGTH=427 /DNA_ID=CAMNT_0024616801 /DNA_START=144 /DNA_END=1427 /DNA_ORIENTATION=+